MTGERPHGRAKYVMEGCRCDVCRAANAEYQRHRSRQRAYGRPLSVDAEPVRQHLLALRNTGIGRRRAAELAGVSHSAVSHILYGQTGYPPAKRIRPETAAKILAIDPADIRRFTDKTRVDITGSRRRLQALVASGRTQRELAVRLGITPANFWIFMHRQTGITVAKQRQISELYDELWNRPPADGSSARHARAYAKRHGWAPPLAWDDDTIDDPTAEPAGVEEVRRKPGGQSKLPPSDELRWLLSQQSLRSVAQRYGVRPDTIEQALRRSA